MQAYNLVQLVEEPVGRGSRSQNALTMRQESLVTVKEILRHKSFEMTLRYAHLSGDHKKSAVDALQKCSGING